jgi:hypothetical protein
LTDTLKHTVQTSALLVAIMSPFFLQGTWCADEVRWFGEANERRAATREGSVKERIFVVRSMETDESNWPATLRDSSNKVLKGYLFHPPPSDLDEETRPYGWPKPQERDHDYTAAVRRLASDIARQIKAIKAINAASAGPGPEQISRNVFLGFMHDTIETRPELRERLTSAGLTVLPPEADDPVDEASLREALDKHLGQCAGLVLAANEYGGTWPRDQPGGFIGLQIQKARQLKVDFYLWLQIDDPGKAKKPDYRQYLETLCQQPGLAWRHEDLDRFIEHVMDGLNKPDLRQPDPDLENNAVICSNQPDDKVLCSEFSDIIKEILRETGRDNYEFAFADPKSEQIKLTNIEKRIRESDTVLVLCFDQDWDWARRVLRQLNLLSHLRTGGKARLLVAGPRDMQEGLYDARTLGFRTIDGLSIDEAQLKDLLKREIQSALQPKNNTPSNGTARPAR